MGSLEIIFEDVFPPPKFVIFKSCPNKFDLIINCSNLFLLLCWQLKNKFNNHLKHINYSHSLEILDRVFKLVKEGESSTPLFLLMT